MSYRGGRYVISSRQNVVTGRQNVVTGRQNVATGRQNVATGRQNVATGRQNVATGRQNVVTGRQNVATGRQNVMSGGACRGEAAPEAVQSNAQKRITRCFAYQWRIPLIYGGAHTTYGGAHTGYGRTHAVWRRYERIPAATAYAARVRSAVVRQAKACARTKPRVRSSSCNAASLNT